MKSLLQEASSVEKAIAQAWEAAGQPTEFTVKVLEHGERGFFGFVSKPAVVSITYRPLVQHVPQQRRHEKTSEHDSSRPQKHTREPREQREPRESRENREVRESRPSRKEETSRPDQPRDRAGLLSFDEAGGGTESAERKNDRPRRERGGRDRDRKPGGRFVKEEKPARGLLMYTEGEEPTSERPAHQDYPQTSAAPAMQPAPQRQASEEDEGALVDGGEMTWSAEQQQFVESVLQEIMKFSGFDVSFTSRIDDMILHIEFEREFIDTADLARSFYASVSFLMIQILKRTYKRRFRGFKILLAVKR